MAKMKLTETLVSVGQILERDSAKLPQGVLCRAKYNICNIGELNRNKRIYEKAVWEKVLGTPDIKEKLEKRTLFAHAEHPEGMQSSTEKIAGIVKGIEIGEKNVYAVMEVLDTPYGRICDTLLRAGCGLGTSTRAEGELEEAINETDGSKFFRVVPESYNFVTVDWTADPSTYGAFPESVEKDLTKTIKAGLEAKKIDAQYATCLLETMKCSEAVALCETLKEKDEHIDKHGKHLPGDENVCDTCGKHGTKIVGKNGDGNYCSVECRDKKNESVAEGIAPNALQRMEGLIPQKSLDKLMSGIAEIKSVLIEDGFHPIEVNQFIMMKVRMMKESKEITEAINEQGGSHSTGLGEIWKAFEVALKSETKKKIDESTTNKEKSNVLVAEFKSLRERNAILEAENAKLIELSDSSMSSVRKNYARDILDYNKKINILQEELSTISDAHDSDMNMLTERFESDKKELAEEVKKEFETRITTIEKVALDSTQKVYESKFKELKETFLKETKELEENYNKQLIKMLVRIKVREAGLESELSPRHLTLLESCNSDKAIEAKIEEMRVLIHEGSFHSDEFKSTETPIYVSVNETKSQETKELESSLGQTVNLLKSFK